ncbi:MAG: thiamine-phosphate pyrophosphorylase [Clostridiaceae bacterium]|nr:thiamine-phosphate pyrophosphorylase [Clostridiaceae bacterium]
MNKLYRILDANINRASEGLRVLEDLSRFYFNDMLLSKELKKLRHLLRKNSTDMLPELIENRDSVNDVGLNISMNLKIDEKSSVFELIISNFKRVQEALRTIEETLKLVDRYELSKKYEGYRFDIYNIEKKFVNVVIRRKKETENE